MGLLMHKGKSYGGGLTRLLDMLDVNISNPSNGELLQYNSTSGKWKNSSDVWDTMAQNGAHNLLLNRTGGSNLLGGITITTNADKSISVASGTSTSSDSIMISGSGTSYWEEAEQYLEAGTYIASINAGSVPITLRLNIEAGGTHSQQGYVITGNNKQTFTITAKCRIIAWLEIENGASVPSGTLYPMIKLASDHNTDYTPYAPTNRDCVSYAVNSKLGAKNLLNITLTTQTVGGVTLNVNSTTGAITISSSNVTSTVDKTYCVRKLNVGRYRLSIQTTSNKVQFYINAYNGDTMVKQLGAISTGNNEVYFSVDNNGYDNVRFGIYISSTAGTLPSATYYPMLTIAEDTDPTYAPYAKTNRQLTEDVDGKWTEVTSGFPSPFTGGFVKYKVVGNICYMYGRLDILGTSTLTANNVYNILTNVPKTLDTIGAGTRTSVIYIGGATTRTTGYQACVGTNGVLSIFGGENYTPPNNGDMRFHLFYEV